MAKRIYRMNVDPRIEQILELVSQLASGNLEARVTPTTGDDGLDQIIAALNNLAQTLSVWQVGRDKVERRLNELLETIIALASLDFSQQAPVSDEGDVFDALATGLNAMGEELQASVVSKTYLDNIITSMIDTLVVTDTEGIIQTVNRATLDLLGYSEAELVGQPITKILLAETFKETGVGDFMALDAIRDIEVIYQSKDGRRIPVSFSASVLGDEQGQPQGVVCVAQDITERKQVEAALQTRLGFETLVANISATLVGLSAEEIDDGIRNVLKSIAEVTGAVRSSIFLFSDNLTTISNTHEWCADPNDSQQDQLQAIPADLFGWYFLKLKRHEAVIVSRLDDLPPDEAQAELEWLETYGFRALLFVPMISNNRLVGAMGFYGPPEQEIEWSEEYISLLKLVSDTIMNALERKQAEKTLAESEARLAEAQRITHVGSWARDMKTDTGYWSDEHYRIFGLSPQDKAPSLETVINSIHPDDRPGFRQSFYKALEQKAPSFTATYRIVRPNGEIRIIESRREAIFDEVGDVVRVNGVIQDVTERKQAEEALRRSEALLNATSQITRTGGWELDLRTNELFWTDTLREIHELPLDYVPNVSEVLNSYIPEHIPHIQAAVEGAVAGKAYDMELQIITAKQKRLWVRVIGRPVYEDGQIVKLQGVLQDIHARKLVDDALRQSEANLQEAQQIAKLGNFVFNLQNQEVSWSDELYRIFGLEMGQEITLERYQSLLAPEDFQRVMGAVAETIETLQPYNLEHDIILPDGQRKHLYVVGRPVLDDTGQIDSIFGIVQDITKAKQAEKSLSEHRALLEGIINNSSISIYVLDTEGHFILINDRFAEIFDLDKEAVIGRTDFDIFPADTAKAYQNSDLEILRQGKLIQIEEQLELEDGIHNFITLKFPLLDATGAPYALCGLATDITERKQIEAQIKASLEEKEVLLKEIHHRVKNNMQIISSLLDLQADNITDEGAREVFKESQQRVKSMALIHEQLYQSTDLAQIDFVEYVARLTDHLLRSYATQASSVALHVDIDPLFLSVETAIPCGLIINELITNAFKHAFPNGKSGEIYVGLQRLADGQLTLSIRDNGVGLPADLDIRQIQSLGLTLMTTLVRQLNGTVDIHNNGGAEFRVTFTK